jgi:hypothetical protein
MVEFQAKSGPSAAPGRRGRVGLSVQRRTGYRHLSGSCPRDGRTRPVQPRARTHQRSGLGDDRARTPCPRLHHPGSEHQAGFFLAGDTALHRTPGSCQNGPPDAVWGLYRSRFHTHRRRVGRLLLVPEQSSPTSCFSHDLPRRELDRKGARPSNRLPVSLRRSAASAVWLAESTTPIQAPSGRRSASLAAAFGSLAPCLLRIPTRLRHTQPRSDSSPESG